MDRRVGRLYRIPVAAPWRQPDDQKVGRIQKHEISNPFTRMMVRQIVQNEGYVCPEMCSPEELLENES